MGHPLISGYGPRGQRANDIWTYLDEPTPRSLDAIQGLIAEALKEQADGDRLPFAIIDRSTGRAIGSVSYIDIQPVHHGLEIGWAWVTPAAWGAGVSAEAATLLIDHAFRRLQAIRVARGPSAVIESSETGICVTRSGAQRAACDLAVFRDDDGSPAASRSLTWLPRCETGSKPALRSAARTSRLEYIRTSRQTATSMGAMIGASPTSTS